MMIGRIFLFVLVSTFLLTAVLADGRAIEAFDSSNSPSSSSTLTTSDYSSVPSLTPQYDWSKHYINLFRQAIKEKYGTSDETLNERLRIISVVKGEEVDGFAIPIREGLVQIHYLYQIDWAVYSGTATFDIIGNTNDEERVENVKYTLFPIFNINKIISKDEARSLGLVYQDLASPWYSDYNSVYIEGSQNLPSYSKLVFDARKIINEADNKCLIETYSLETGEKLYSKDQACIINALGREPPRMPSVARYSPDTVVVVVLSLLVIVAAAVFFFKNKSIVRRFNHG